MILQNGSCLDFIKTLPDSSVDLIVTDPPYRTISGGNKSEKWKSGYAKSVLHRNDGKIFDNNNIDIEDWIGECYRVLKDSTHIYIMTNLLNLSHYMNVIQEAGFEIHNLLVWEKNTANANRWYMKNCEYTIFARKGAAKTINNPSSKTVHTFPNIVGNKNHPTEKPVELMKFYIENSSNEGDVVLDPFMGGGSTGVACKQLGRDFIGYEIDEKYFNIAKERIENTKEENLTKWSILDVLTI